MSNYFTKDQYLDIGSLTDAGTIAYSPPVPIDVKRIILRTTTAYTVANDIVTVNVMDIDGSPTATKGTFTIAFTGSVVGDIVNVDLKSANPAATVAADGSLYSKPGPGFITLLPGQSLQIVDGGQQTVGASQAYIEYEKQGFLPNVGTTNATKTSAYTPA